MGVWAHLWWFWIFSIFLKPLAMVCKLDECQNHLFEQKYIQNSTFIPNRLSEFSPVLHGGIEKLISRKVYKHFSTSDKKIISISFIIWPRKNDEKINSGFSSWLADHRKPGEFLSQSFLSGSKRIFSHLFLFSPDVEECL